MAEHRKTGPVRGDARFGAGFVLCLAALALTPSPSPGAVLGIDVGVTHLVATIVGLAIGTTYLLIRVSRLKPVATMAASLLITQVLAGLTSAVLLRLSEQPVHDAQTRVAHQVAIFDAVVFWLVGTLFFPDDRRPPLDHEHQLLLATEAGCLALDRSIAFLEAHAGSAFRGRPDR